MADFLSESFSPLCEKSIRADGTVGLKLISPGWGSSGYYSESVLQRDIPAAFPPGTQMFWNHPTATEEMERPEGDLNHLAAVIVSEPRWEPNGLKGAGMYADAKVFTGYAEALDQIGEHIGVSIRGYGSKEPGTAEGRQGLIVSEISHGKSVDFVTKPGAGGAVLSIFESAPGAGKLPDIGESQQRAAADNPSMEDAMSDELQQQLAESQRENARLREMLLLNEAKEFVIGALAAADLPDVTKTRLQRQLVANPPVKEGKIDQDAYKTRAETAVNEARAEIAAVLGDDGKIRGQGASDKPATPDVNEAQQRLDRAFALLNGGTIHG